MRTLALAAAVLIVGCVTHASVSSAHPASRPCSSYPTPGQLAPAHTKVPAVLSSQYGVLRRPQRTTDMLRTKALSTSLTAAGVIRSGIRYLGPAAFGGRIYAVPALHLLAFRIAPARCLPKSERALERELLPQLKREYAHAALCLVIVRDRSVNPSCGKAKGHTEALLYTSGTPGFGIVPNGVHAVTVTYANAPPRTLNVRHNFFTIVAPKQTAAPCGLQWLDSTGNVIKIVTGCTYVPQELVPLNTYISYVSTKFGVLQSQVATLVSAINAGNLQQAQAAWLPAHLTWLDIGQDDGAYGCFGDLGRSIDGTAAGYPGGTADPNFTGFHKVEFDLWTNHDLSAAATDAAKLQSLVAKLVKIPLSTELPANAADLANWVLRPHEIMEDANRDTLTGNDDYGSGTSLDSLTADVAADEEFLHLLAPVIDPLSPHLVPRARSEFAALSSAIAATSVNGAYPPLEALSEDQRQTIDADVGAALETLAPIPDLITSTGKGAPET